MRRMIRSGDRHRDDGFTLVEVIVAMFVTVLVMSALLGVLISSLTTIAQARQRQAGTALATQALERLRALPYDDVTAADGSSLGATVPHVTNVSGVRHFNHAGLAVNEPLIVNKYSAQNATATCSATAFTNCVETQDNVTYTVRTYVTRPAPTAGGSQTFNLTAIVTWTSTVFPNGREAAQQSTTYSPAGCLSTAQSPFAAPCQDYFTAQGGQAAAGMSVVPFDDTVDLTIAGFSGEVLELTLPSLGAGLNVEQTVSGTATAGTPSVRLDGTIVGETAGTASADSDPSSPTSQFTDSATVSGSGGTTSVSGTAGLLRGTAAGGSGSVASSVVADTTVCRSITNSPLTTGPSAAALRGCSSGSMRQTGETRLVYEPLPAHGFGTTSVTLATIAAQPASGSRAVAGHLTVGNGTICDGTPSGTPIGCGYGAVRREMGTINVGNAGGGAAVTPLPLNGPVGAQWQGLWYVTGLTESASAERGTGSDELAYTRSGTLRIYNPTTNRYDDVALSGWAATASESGAPASQRWDIPMTTVTYPSGGGGAHVLTIEMTASVTVQRPTKSQSGSVDCKDVACVAQVTGSSGIVGETFYVLKKDGVEIGRFALVTDLGGAVAQASYKAASDAP